MGIVVVNRARAPIGWSGMTKRPVLLFTQLVGSLPYMYDIYILIHMRTTLNIDDDLIEEARRLTGMREKTALVREGLEALIARESARRLKELGGTDKMARVARRRRLR